MVAQDSQAVGARKSPKSAKAAVRKADRRATAAPPRAPAAASAGAEPDSGLGTTHSFIEPGQRRAMIAEAAYYLAERRGFEAGRELEDWYRAEDEINGRLTRGELPDVTPAAS